jgi:hypothetical protein
MAVLNPPSALPGLARSITNHLLTDPSSYDEERLTALFAPRGISDIQDPTRGVDNTLKAARAIGLITQQPSGIVEVSGVVKARAKGKAFTRNEFRQVLRQMALDVKRDGNPWAGDLEARTAGARDLSRAASWFLSQDALGPALSWAGKDIHSVQELQSNQLRHISDDERPVGNNTRWESFARWALALGLAEATAPYTLVPLPLRAVRDVVERMVSGVRPVVTFLNEISTELPVVDGGVSRAGLRALLDEDSDPGVRANAVDTSISQSLLILEDEGRVKLIYGADAEARVFTDPEGDRKVSGVEVMDGVER